MILSHGDGIVRGCRRGYDRRPAHPAMENTSLENAPDKPDAERVFAPENAPAALIGIIKICILLCWLGWAICNSSTAAIALPIFHLDGAFQTASGLYRLDAGQFPGRDFFPYLGPGPLFVLYPIFKLCGANLAASTFSAQLLVLLTSALAVSLVWHLIWRPRSFITSLVAGTLLYWLPVGIINSFGLWARNGSGTASFRKTRFARCELRRLTGSFWFTILGSRASAPPGRGPSWPVC